LSINRFLTEVTPGSSTEYSLWKATKYLKRPIAEVPPIRKPDGILASKKLEKTSKFAQHLEKRFHPNPGLDTLPVLHSNDYLDKMSLVILREAV
jgi:hypothetical protein